MNNLNHRISRLRPLVRGGFSLLFFFLCFLLHGQGFERYYEVNQGVNEATDLIQTQDEGFVFTGSKEEKSFTVYKTDPYGKTLWIYNYSSSPVIAATAVVEMASGELLVAGYCDGCLGGGLEDPFVVKLGADGTEIWRQEFLGSGNSEEIHDVVELPNGNIALVGNREIGGQDDIYLLILDADGNFISDHIYQPSAANDLANAIIVSTDGNLVLAGSMDNGSDVYVQKTDFDGMSIWANSFGSGSTNIGNDIIETNDGGFAVTGYTIDLVNGQDILFGRLESNGALQGGVLVFGGENPQQGKSLVQLADGSYLISGSAAENDANRIMPAILKLDANATEVFTEYLSDPAEPLILGGAEQIVQTLTGEFVIVGQRNADEVFSSTAYYLAKVEPDGSYLKNTIRGNVFFDDNQNCMKDGGDFGLRGWGVVLRGTTNWYATTDVNGDYEILAPAGSYDLEYLPPGDNIWTSCNNSWNINLANSFEEYELDFAVREDKDCYDLQLDIANPYLSPCQNSIYTIRYGNDGTVAATGSYLELNLDETLTLVNSDIAPIDLGDNNYRFTVGLGGTVPVLSRDSFTIEVAVACDAVEKRAHRVIGQLFPNAPCDGVDPAWDGGSIEVTGVCDEVEGVVVFSNKNVGAGSTTNVSSSIIIEEHLLGRIIEPVDLDDNELDTVHMVANGATYRMITLQSENHPGDSRPTISVEGCSTDGNYTTGFATEWPEDDYNDNRAVSHEENIDISQQTDQFKRGYPKGFDDAFNYINTNTDLTYQINFRNTGQDSAIMVVIRDTISSFLDPATVVPGASSHDYSYEVYGGGILKFTFKNINLPPGSGADTEGYVRYRISQKPNNPPGTLLESSATIYLGYKAPQFTSETFHTISDSLLVRIIPEAIPGLTGVEAFPNPFSEQTTITIDGSLPIQDGILRVYNGLGQLLSVKPFSGKKVELLRSEVTAGALFFQLEADGRLLATGQLIAQ